MTAPTQIPFAGISNPVNFRNIVINGDMQIAQRATSVASITVDGYYTVDRWNFFPSSLGTWTMSQSTDVPTGQGFANSLKLDCTTADATPSASDVLLFRQKFEGQNLQYLKKGTANALPLTASFWVKSTKTGTFILELFDNNNTRQVSKSYTVNTTNTWEFKTVTFPGDTTGAFTNNNDTSLFLQFWLGAGTDFTSGTLNTTWASYTNANRAVGQVNIADSTANDWLITGVQLEAGEQASGFEFMPIDVNLNRCLRYYQKFSQTENSYWIGNGFADVNTDCRMVLNYYPKRANPSGSFSGTLLLAPSSRTTTTMLFDSARKNTVLFYYNSFSASGSAGDGYAMVLNTSATYLELDSEL